MNPLDSSSSNNITIIHPLILTIIITVTVKIDNYNNNSSNNNIHNNNNNKIKTMQQNLLNSTANAVTSLNSRTVANIARNAKPVSSATTTTASGSAIASATTTIANSTPSYYYKLSTITSIYILQIYWIPSHCKYSSHGAYGLLWVFMGLCWQHLGSLCLPGIWCCIIRCWWWLGWLRGSIWAEAGSRFWNICQQGSIHFHKASSIMSLISGCIIINCRYTMCLLMRKRAPWNPRAIWYKINTTVAVELIQQII